MILILAQSSDSTVRFVAHKLRRRGAEVLWFDNAQFPARAQFTARYGGVPGPQRLLRYDGQEFELNRITTAWYRSFSEPGVHEEIDEPLTRRFVERQSRAFLSGLWQTLTCRWVPAVRPTVLWAEHKARQLELAAELGFAIPPTLIGNDPAEFLAFYRQHNGHLISKTLHNGQLWATENEHNGAPVEATVYATRVTPRAVGYAASVRYCPMIFQAYVPKRLELRVTVVGQQVFACEIHSQQTPHTQHDWRRYDLSHTPHRAHSLPKEIERLCLELSARLGLCYGTIDLVLTPDGRYVFLEINPNGQFAWIEGLTGLPISDALCDLLLEHETNAAFRVAAD